MRHQGSPKYVHFTKWRHPPRPCSPSGPAHGDYTLARDEDLELREGLETLTASGQDLHALQGKCSGDASAHPTAWNPTGSRICGASRCGRSRKRGSRGLLRWSRGKPLSHSSPGPSCSAGTVLSRLPHPASRILHPATSPPSWPLLSGPVSSPSPGFCFLQL